MEWMTDDEWELEWQLFFMLENGLVEFIGEGFDGEPLFKLTPEFHEFTKLITDMFEDDED
jgi:hypothetical protein